MWLVFSTCKWNCQTPPASLSPRVLPGRVNVYITGKTHYVYESMAIFKFANCNKLPEVTSAFLVVQPPFPKVKSPINQRVCWMAIIPFPHHFPVFFEEHPTQEPLPM